MPLFALYIYIYVYRRISLEPYFDILNGDTWFYLVCRFCFVCYLFALFVIPEVKCLLLEFDKSLFVRDYPQ